MPFPMFFSSGQTSTRRYERSSHSLVSRETTRAGKETLNIHGGIQHWIKYIFTRQQTEIYSSVQKESEFSTNFRLIDVLADLSKRLLENPDLLIEGTQEKQELEALLQEQISAFVSEQLGLPYHSYANVVDWSEFIATGLLHTYHPKYKNTTTQGDLLVMATRASEVNVGAEGDRYTREKKQLQTLYHEKLAPELQNWEDPKVWEATTVGNLLSDAVRNQYGLHDENEQIFVGNKYALVMPENSKVYPEGKAYTNIHQLVFIPKRNQALLLIEQWFDAHTYRDQAFILNQWEKDAVPQKDTLSEDVLMGAVITLPAEVKASPAFEVFADMAKKLSKNDRDTDFRLSQQATLGLIHANKESISQASTFLTQILIAEYLVCLEHPEALTDIPARLWGAYEMMAHPFLVGESFQYAAARAAYMSGYLQPWIDTALRSTTPALLSDARRRTTHQSVSHFVENRNQLHAPLTVTQKNQRNTSLQTYAKLGYPQILQRAVSEAWCATGTIGGLTEVGKAFNSSLGQSVLNGHFVNHSELAQLIGQERAQQWQKGICLNPECPRGNAEQLVGECGFCIHCELLSQAGQELKRKEKGAQTVDALQKFAQRSFTSPDDIAHFYAEHFTIEVGILPSYIVGGERVLR